MLVISPGHPDRFDPLLARLVNLFATDGADVVIGAEADNVIRPRRAGDPGDLPWIVEAEGVPNLLHELLHALQAGGLAIDHGIDYRLIPFDTEVPAQRLLLWQELTCCTISCAYLADRPAQIQPWFNEQTGILHHFYGHDSAAPFLAHVEALLVRHPGELEAVVGLGYRLTEERLGSPPARLEFEALWKAMQACGRGPIFGA